MQTVYDLPNVQYGVGDACMYGKRIPVDATDGAGMYILKKYKWLSNSDRLLRATCKTCNNTHEHYRSSSGENVCGSLTKWSGEYTPQLARSILRAVQDICAQAR